MRRPKGILVLLVVTLLATASLKAVSATTMTGEARLGFRNTSHHGLHGAQGAAIQNRATSRGSKLRVDD